MGHKKSHLLRMVFPQWQGADICAWLPELNRREATTGYYLGAQLLEFLAPRHKGRTVTIKVSRDCSRRRVQDGVLDRDVLLRQARRALKALRHEQPRQVAVLGGECSVSVVPFAYLRELYGEDLALIWIDAHPDITLPGDPYTGYHAMAVTALMGAGDQELIGLLPACFTPSQILFVGLREWERPEVRQRHAAYGIAHLSPEQVRCGQRDIRTWLSGCGASKVAIHFDLDVLDPRDMISAVGVVDNGLTLEEVVNTICGIHECCEVVGLTVAEPMPRLAIRLQSMLARLPLMH